MLYLIFLLVPLIQAIDQITINDNAESTESFKIHYDEPVVLLEFPLADDAQLITYQNSSFCTLHQQTVKTQTQQFTIIQDKDFKEYEFENDTPLNFRQFTGMVHVNDGMLAITSDSIAYLMKFNYDKALDKSGFKTYGNGENFADVVWKADLQQIAPSLMAKEEIPTLVYARKSNLALVIYSDSAQYFSMTEMENNLDNLTVSTIGNWRPRQTRGLTKEIDGILFSAVGPDGLDIYVIDRSVQFHQNFQFNEFGFHNQQLILKDFSIVKVDDNNYYFYLLDENIGMVVLGLKVGSNYQFSFSKILAAEQQSGGLAVDTRNGQNVFAAFYQYGVYFYIEYLVNVSEKTCEIITKKESSYTIRDVDVTDEFAIISGFNHHQIVFQNGYDQLSPHKEQIVFTQIGMRDFEFFKYSYSEEELKESEPDEFQYDDFFFGVTSTNAFLTRFKFVPCQVVCYSSDENQLSKSQFYSVQFNNSVIENGIVQKNKINRTTKNFSVQVVKTYLFDDRLTAVYVMFSLIGSVIFLSSGVICYWWKNFSYEQQKLDAQIDSIRKQALDNSNQIKLDETIQKNKQDV